MLENYGDLLDAKELAKILKISKATVYKEISSKKFGEPIKIGKMYRIPKLAVVDYFLKNQ